MVDILLPFCHSFSRVNRGRSFKPNLSCRSPEARNQLCSVVAAAAAVEMPDVCPRPCNKLYRSREGKSVLFDCCRPSFSLGGGSGLIRADAGAGDPVALVSSDIISDKSNELRPARRLIAGTDGGNTKPALGGRSLPSIGPSFDLWRVEQEEMQAEWRNDFRLTEGGTGASRARSI